MAWVRAQPTMDNVDQNMHRIALAFTSDFTMPSSIRFKYPQTVFSLITSLDHTIWFHRDIDFNKWHLYVWDCQSAVANTSLNALR